MKFAINNKIVKFNIGVTGTDLHVETAEVNEIEVTVEGLRKNTSEELFEINLEDDILTIKEKKGSLKNIGGMFSVGGIFSGNGFSGADIKMVIPSSLTTEGKIGTVNGDVKVSNLTYNGKVASVSGDIILFSVVGNITVGTVSGDVKIEKSKLNEISIGTVSGDVEIESEFDLADDGQVKTVSGDIDLNATEYLTDKKIVIKTVSGDFSKKGKITDEDIVFKNKRNKKSGSHDFKFKFDFLGENIHKIVNSTVKNAMNAVFSLEKADISVNTGKDKEDSVVKILKMVEDGKISADEAAKLIESL